MKSFRLATQTRKDILPGVPSWAGKKALGKSVRLLITVVLLLAGIFLLTGCGGSSSSQTPVQEPLSKAEPEKKEIGVVNVEPGMMLERDIIPQLCDIFSLSEEEVKEKMAGVEASNLINPGLTDFRCMEGMILPGEHRVFQGDTLEKVLSQWVNEMENRYNKLASEDNGNNGLTAAEHLILASVLEGECLGANRQEEVAKVLLTRLAIDSKLQCCATAEYALGYQRPYLTLKDIEIESDYNTYHVPGLPVGPICSFSDASLGAAISQQANYTHYYFYYDFVLKDVFFYGDYTTFLEGAKVSKERFDANSSVGRHDKINKQELYHSVNDSINDGSANDNSL